MGLGGEVDHGLGLLFREKPAHQAGVADIAMDETVAGIGGDVGQIGQIAGIGQLVQIDDADISLPVQQITNEIGPDEAASPGNQQRFGHGKIPQISGFKFQVLSFWFKFLCSTVQIT